MGSNPKVWFWSGVGIGIVSQFIQPYFPRQTWITALGLLVGLLCCAWAVVLWLREHRASVRNWVRKVEPWHLQIVGLAGVIVFACVALFGLIWQRYYPPSGAAGAKDAVEATKEVNGPISWEFGSSGSPLGTSRSSGAPLWVDAFQIIGRNTSDLPVHARNASVTSDITGQTIPLLFSDKGKLVEANKVTIIPGGKLILIGRIKPTDPAKSQGLVVDEFRDEFGAFTFVFEHGDPKYYFGENNTFTRRFTRDEVEAILARIDAGTRKRGDRDIVVRDAPHYARGLPNYDKWDEQNVLRLFEAACLWNDEEPTLPMSESSLRTYWDFYRAIYERRLGTKANLDEAIKLGMAQTGFPLAPSDADPVNVNTKVSRQNLKPYAEKTGIRPKFLYADQRAGKRPA